MSEVMDRPGLNKAQIAGRAQRATFWAERRARAERAAIHNALNDRMMATMSELTKRFPKCFMPPFKPKLPISIGITEVVRIAAPDMDHRDLANAIRRYCGDISYLRGLVAGAPRFNLEGNPAGVV